MKELFSLYYSIGGFSENEHDSVVAHNYMIEKVLPSMQRHPGDPDYYLNYNISTPLTQFSGYVLDGPYNPTWAKFFMKHYHKDHKFLEGNNSNIYNNDNSLKVLGKTPESLSKAAMSMDIDFDSIELHNSKDDAYLTMLVAKELEKISDTPLHQLINLSNHIAIDSNNIVNPNKARSNELKLLISKYPERNKAFSFCLSEELEAKDKENDYVLIKSILDAGYSYTTRVNASRVYVSDTETDPRDETYLKRIEKHPDKTKKISKKQLLSMIKNKPSVKV